MTVKQASDRHRVGRDERRVPRGRAARTRGKSWYSTSESLARSVVQLIVACEDVTAEAMTAQITGSILVILTLVTGDGILCAAMTEATLRTSANGMVERILEDMMAPLNQKGP